MLKDELGGKIVKEFCAHRAKTYSYLMGDDSEVKKAKGIKEDYNKTGAYVWKFKDCLLNGEVILNKDLKLITIKCTQKKLITLH